MMGGQVSQFSDKQAEDYATRWIWRMLPAKSREYFIEAARVSIPVFFIDQQVEDCAMRWMWHTATGVDKEEVLKMARVQLEVADKCLSVWSHLDG